MCQEKERTENSKPINHKSYGHRFINKATYGRKVEDIYEYTLDSKQWMSPMIFHLWYSRLTDLFLLGCITTSSQHFNFNCDLYSARDYQHCWADVSGRLRLFAMIASDRLFFVSRSFSEYIPCVCDADHVMNGYQDPRQLFPAQHISSQ